MAERAAHAADDKKAKDIVLIAVEAVSSVADYFMVCTGTSTTQVKAIADSVAEGMEREGFPLPRIEGNREGRWILQDYGTVVVHVMLDEEREFYSLERLWKNGRVETWQAPSAAL
jgi:ribosome-associated protein